MKIRSKLILNASIVIFAVGAVSVTSFISMRSIKGKLSYLTEKSTPFQMRTVEFQRALQGATADLIKVIAARNEPEFAAARGEAEKSLEEVKRSQESLEGISGEKLEAAGELNGIAGELFSTMTAKLRSERESAEANAHIAQRAREANARIRELESKVKTLQQSSSAAYATANTVPQTRMDLDTGDKACEVCTETCQQCKFSGPQPVIEAMQQDRMQTGATGQGFQGRARGRVPIEYDLDIFFQGVEHG